jgi:hypothetical protein
MKFWMSFLLVVMLTACNAANEDDTESTQTVVILEPSMIAADFYTPAPRPTSGQTALAPVRLVPGSAPASGTGNATQTSNTPAAEGGASTEATESAQPPAQDAAPAAEATQPENSAELQALTDNPSIILAMEMDSECFLAGDFVSFRLTITSRETQPIWFYKMGRWQFSLNGTPVGPDISPREPTGREEFEFLDPNETYTQEEDDLGLWVQSLGPEYFDMASPTGIGLPAGTYWVTFLYNNDQDGQREQPGRTFLIDSPAWRGTIVAPQLEFKVVNDLSEC